MTIIARFAGGPEDMLITGFGQDESEESGDGGGDGGGGSWTDSLWDSAKKAVGDLIPQECRDDPVSQACLDKAKDALTPLLPGGQKAGPQVTPSGGFTPFIPQSRPLAFTQWREGLTLAEVPPQASKALLYAVTGGVALLVGFAVYKLVF